MRKLVSILFITMLFMGSFTLEAANVFPEFEKGPIRVYIPIEEIRVGLQEDLEHEVGLNFSYNITGQLLTEAGQGHIQMISEGFDGVTDKSTPWKTLTELLAAYQSTDADAVRALYTPESLPKINNLLSEPGVEQRFIEYMQAIQGMNILLGFEHKHGFFVFVDVDYGDTPESGLTPFFFVETDDGYLLEATTVNEAIIANIGIYLEKGHTVADLPAPKHGLSVEKKGTGDGSVRGSGIDCGEDCIEVYVEGTAVWLKAAADEYSTFEGWLVDGEPLKDRLIIKEDTTVTAVFTKIPPKEYTVTIEKSGTGEGTVTDSDTACESTDCLTLFSLYAEETDAPVMQSGIDCGDTCSVPYTEGTTVYLKAVAADGVEFVEWQINGEPVTEPVEMTEDTVITPIFNTLEPPQPDDPGTGEPQP